MGKTWMIKKKVFPIRITSQGKIIFFFNVEDDSTVLQFKKKEKFY